MSSSLSSYKAAVSELQTIGWVTDGNELVVVQQNLKRYDQVAEAVSEQGAEMIVFPKWGLFGNCRKRNRCSKSIPAHSRDTILPFYEPIGEPGVDLLTDDSRHIWACSNCKKIQNYGCS